MPRLVPEDVASAVDARGEAAPDVLASCLGVLDADASFELGPVDEVEDRLSVTLRAGAYRYGGVVVWGATALTLGMLAHVLDE